jgi:hypothetical protein
VLWRCHSSSASSGYRNDCLAVMWIVDSSRLIAIFSAINNKLLPRAMEEDVVPRYR